MTTQQQQPGQPVVYITQNPVAATDSISQAAQQRAVLFYRLGITQIVLGILTFCLGITILVYSIVNEQDIYYPDYPYYYFYDDVYGQIATGVWSSLFFLTSGSLGIVSSQKKTRSLVVASLVMAIFSALAAGTLCGLEIAGSVWAYSFYYDFDSNWEVSMAIHTCLAVFGLTEFVIAIVHASYCCNCNGCDSPESCCMPTNQTDPGHVTYTYTNYQAFPQASAMQQPVQNAYIQTVPMQVQPNHQVVQSPYLMTSGLPQQVLSSRDLPAVPSKDQEKTEKF